LLYFIRAREAARIRKELIGGDGPHSDDKIIAEYRFCNINREHDSVTRWIAANLRPWCANKSRRDVIVNYIIGRVFNEPKTLEQVLPVTDVRAAFAKLREYQDSGNKIMRGAYMVGAHGPKNKGVRVLDYYERILLSAEKVNWTLCHTLSGVAEQLLRLEGFAEFMTNQVCTDLRHSSHWSDASDWETFVLCGPGSRRGVDRYDSSKIVTDPKLIGSGLPEHYTRRIIEIREDIWYDVGDDVQNYFLDPNNLSNTFCEFDKYERASFGSGRQLSLRKYTN
jgi:hypothetical protein